VWFPSARAREFALAKNDEFELNKKVVKDADIKPE
jgi:hypothetical protein